MDVMIDSRSGLGSQLLRRSYTTKLGEIRTWCWAFDAPIKINGNFIVIDDNELEKIHPPYDRTS